MTPLTTAQALANVESARRAVAEAAPTGESESLARLVNTLARAEGEYRVYSQAESMRERGMTKDEITYAIYDMLTNPTDDTWSGRENDSKRAKHDGMKSAASSLRWMT